MLIGVPLGTLLLTRVSPEFFRRFVMAIDGILVSYGLSRVLIALKWVNTNTSYIILVVLFAAVIGLAWYGLRHLAPDSSNGSPIPTAEPGLPPPG